MTEPEAAVEITVMVLSWLTIMAIAWYFARD